MYDLIVAGGGFTGVAAAISAAREGLKVLILEKSGFLGGAACNCYVNPFMKYRIGRNGERYAINRGLFLKFVDELDRMGGLHDDRMMFNEEYLKLIFDRMTKAYGVDVRFHSHIIEVKREGSRIVSVTAAGKADRREYAAAYFIDATGDADVAALAGCPYKIGREGDNQCQPMTLCFRMANVDVEKVLKNKQGINELYQKAQREGKIKNPREDILKFRHSSKDVLHLNSTRIINRCPVDVDDLSAAEMEAREQVYELYQFLKENVDGCRESCLLASAPEIGVRESRMIVGDYTITGEDLLSCTKFEDSIACGAYQIDIHNPDGTGTTLIRIPDDNFYTIPYRALLPQGVDNLLAAGRCISSTHEAQSAYRIMPICCSIGEGAGIAAAVAFQNGTDTRGVDIAKVHEIMDRYDAMYQ